MELLSPLISLLDLTSCDEEDDPTNCTDVDEDTGSSRSTCVQCGGCVGRSIVVAVVGSDQHHRPVYKCPPHAADTTVRQLLLTQPTMISIAIATIFNVCKLKTFDDLQSNVKFLLFVY